MFVRTWRDLLKAFGESGMESTMQPEDVQRVAEAFKVLTSMTLLGYACRQVERCPAEGSAEGPGFLQGVERFTLHGKTAARK